MSSMELMEKGMEKGCTASTRPVDTNDQLHRPSRIANPGPLGLFSFASTTFILSMYNIQARGITHPNVVIGMAVFTGGLAQFLAGMWEFPRGNVFGAAAFTSYGAFWMSFATILLPGSGIISSYGTDIEEFEGALGIYLMAWFIFTFFFFITSLRKHVGFISLFGFLTITFLLLAVGKFVVAAREPLTIAGGAMGIITACIAYYIGFSELLTAERRAVVSLPLGAF